MDWLLTLCVIAASVLAAKAFSRTRALKATILALKTSVEILDQRLSRFEDLRASVPEAPLPEAPPDETVGVSAPFPAQMAAPLAPVPAGKGWEEILVENWLVWVGGVALALGGAFLVKLSIDYGLLTPAVRVVLGVLLGIGMAVGGEWVRRREVAQGGDPAAPSPSGSPRVRRRAMLAPLMASAWSRCSGSGTSRGRTTSAASRRC